MDKISIWLFKPFLKSGMAKILDAFNKYERTVSLPFYESRGCWEKLTQEFNRPTYIELMNLLFPDYTTVLFKGATMEAMLHTIRLGLGCRIFKKEKGRYPDSLEELTPEILDTVPVDPFTGKPFVYRVEDTGLIIYSVGNNLKDDEGRGTWMITKLVMEKDDDWAWKEPFLN